jgi:hypothetical protein
VPLLVVLNLILLAVLLVTMWWFRGVRRPRAVPRCDTHVQDPLLEALKAAIEGEDEGAPRPSRRPGGR